jgi:hypothetical protein
MKQFISLLFCGLIASCASHYKSGQMTNHGFDGKKAYSSYEFNSYGVKSKETYNYFGSSFDAEINQDLVTRDVAIELPSNLKDIVKIKRSEKDSIGLKIGGLVDETGNFFVKMALGLVLEVDSGFDKFINMRATEEGGVVLSLQQNTAKFCQIKMDEKFCIMEAELVIPEYISVSYK